MHACFGPVILSVGAQELEVDFKGVCDEVDRKRRELDNLANAIQDIEATRERKISEFRRMQANLMELLHDQKTELDAVREKGAQLEVCSVRGVWGEFRGPITGAGFFFGLGEGSL